MFPRTLWTVILTLLAWIPFGRGSTWAVCGSLGDRAIASVLEAAADSPTRIARTVDLGIELGAPKRPEPARTFLPLVATPREDSRSVAPVDGGGTRPERLPWRIFREKRLSFPHDAIAPPTSRS